MPAQKANKRKRKELRYPTPFKGTSPQTPSPKVPPTKELPLIQGPSRDTTKHHRELSQGRNHICSSQISTAGENLIQVRGTT